MEYDFSDCEFMETDPQELTRYDPNLNVTSAPENLDTIPESDSTFQGTTAVYPLGGDEQTPNLTELTNVELQLTEDRELYLTGEDPVLNILNVYSLPDFGVQKTDTYPALTTVTLIKENSTVENVDLETLQILQQLYTKDDTSAKTGVTFSIEKPCTKPQLRLTQHPADDSAVTEPCLPLFEPQHQPKLIETPDYDLVSPTESMDTGAFSYAMSDDASSIGVPASADREADIESKATYIREVIEKRNNKPDDMSAKLKVHEVILVILLNASHGNKSKDLQRILTFCDQNGRESSTDCRHFKTLDTETMGLLWQKIKGNKKGNYDTFARAMRVRRERSEGFFDYLEMGKGKKKRIYRFGERSMEEMSRFKKTLRQISRPESCSY